MVTALVVTVIIIRVEFLSIADAKSLILVYDVSIFEYDEDVKFESLSINKFFKYDENVLDALTIPINVKKYRFEYESFVIIILSYAINPSEKYVKYVIAIERIIIRIITIT